MQKLRLPSLTQQPSEAHPLPQAPGPQDTVDAVDAGNAAHELHNPSASLRSAHLQDLPAPGRRRGTAPDSMKMGAPSDTASASMTDPPDGTAQQTDASVEDADAGAKLLAPAAADCGAVNPAPPAATDQFRSDAPAPPKPSTTQAKTTALHGPPASSPAPNSAPNSAPSPVAASPASIALNSRQLPGGSPLLCRSTALSASLSHSSLSKHVLRWFVGATERIRVLAPSIVLSILPYHKSLELTGVGVNRYRAGCACGHCCSGLSRRGTCDRAECGRTCICFDCR